ncbi:MAG: hypothetical protein EOP46_14265 [Sphingobacteriaceae bacterium]|nr:MAG: hypothetical protein EOP46_14265 [Sphingobacteriaceae bacterium]
MAKLEHYYTKFEEGKFYHIYNRTIDKQPMFRNDGNFEFFLKKYNEYLSPVSSTYAYCLLGNHFHFLIQVKDVQEISANLKVTFGEKTLHDIVSHRFRKFFQSYALAFNKQHDRIGTLFQTPFKRVLIDNDNYFTKLVYYIHANPQNHKLIDDFREWKWSSYERIMIDKPSALKKKEVIDWFGNKALYKHYHSIYYEELNDQFVIE